jgi:4-amino-4-deoxy-L-arabinose transferase-like glycosyltransferase
MPEPPPDHPIAPRPLTLAGIFGAGLLARSLLLAYRLAALGVSVESLGGSDVPGWLGMARHFRFDFSYWLMGARPPLFPMLVALVYRLGGTTLAAAVLQIVLGALAPVLGALLAYRLLRATALPHPHRLAALAGVVMALDPASVSTSVTLLAEPLFNLLFLACLLSLTVFIQEERWRALWLAALWLAAAMFTRPTAIYFWLAAPLILAPLVRAWWRPALALAAVGLAVYLGWSARNLHYRGVFTYSLQTNFSLLFLRAISAEHLATGAATNDLQVAYVQHLYESVGDTESAALAVPEHFWRFLVADSPALYAEMGRLARQKLLQYWPYALLGTGVGAWRMFGLTRSLPGWFAPVELLYHALLYGLAIWGGWQAIRRKDWLLLLVTAIPIGYVSGLTLLSQTSAMDTRMRTPITAFIAILAVYGAGWGFLLVSDRWSQRSAGRGQQPD